MHGKEAKKLGQYIITNHDFEGSIDEFLAQTAPLIGYLVHSSNALDSALKLTWTPEGSFTVISPGMHRPGDGTGAMRFAGRLMLIGASLSVVASLVWPARQRVSPNLFFQ